MCRKVISRTVSKPSLEPVLKEANDALARDVVAKKILLGKGLQNIGMSLDVRDPVEQILGRANLLLDLIAADYQKTCEEIIINLCNEGGSKKELETASKLYTSFLVNQGFSKNYISSTAEEVFCGADISRCTPGLIRKFFQKFELGTSRKFDLIITGRSSYIKFLAGLFGFEVYASQDDMPDFPDCDLPADLGSGKKKSLTVLDQVSATDPYSAAKRADALLGLAKSFLYLHPSLGGGSIDSIIHVIDVKGKSVTPVSTRAQFRPYRYFGSKEIDPSSVKSLARYVFLTDPSSGRARRQKLIRSLNSVALASNSADLESQLVTIWSAFEALLPEPSTEEGKGVRITHFEPFITPCACYDYLWATFSECYDNLSKEFGGDFAAVVARHGEDASGKGLAKLMIGDEAGKRGLLQVVNSSPLALSRLGKLHDIINCPKKLVGFWNVHEERVGWQVHRIYRERNDIVHQGAKSSFLEALVENSYGYYRSVVIGLEAVHKRFEVGDPARALELIRQLYDDKKSRVKSISADKSIGLDQKKLDILNVMFDDRLC